MSDADNLARLEALYEAFREGRPRPEKVACWLSAACLLMREDDPDALVAQVRDRQAALKSELGWRSPTGALRAIAWYASSSNVIWRRCCTVAQRAALGPSGR